MENEEKKESKKRLMDEGEWYTVGFFRIKRVRLIVDNKNHTRELLPTAKMTQKYLEKNKSILVNAIKISDQDELWQLRIPDTFEAYKILVSLYESGEEDDQKILQTILCNFANSTTILDGLFHNLLLNIGSIYVTRMDQNLTSDEKLKEYSDVMRIAMRTIISDLDFGEKEKEKMERANEEFDKFMAENIKSQLNKEKGN